ncbi:MAG TPA: hypothetical protein VNC78_09970 [Actinomycetota bacterium]|nr:hypothetical protein [Actinomycetota bacterium]
MFKRSTAVGLAAGMLVASLMSAAPAHAGKKPKKIHDSFSATLAPFPKIAAWGDAVGITKPGCSAGEQDVHWVGHPFTPPFNGRLKYYSSGFTGDWDIYVFDGDLAIAKGENAQINTAVPPGPNAPPEEEITLDLKKGQEVVLVMCNWLGAPENTAEYDFVAS